MTETNGKNEEDWVIRSQAPHSRYAREWRRLNDFMGAWVMRLAISDDLRR
jgi:hypothetical protein